MPAAVRKKDQGEQVQAEPALLQQSCHQPVPGTEVVMNGGRVRPRHPGADDDDPDSLDLQVLEMVRKEKLRNGLTSALHRHNKTDDETRPC